MKEFIFTYWKELAYALVGLIVIIITLVTRKVKSVDTIKEIILEVLPRFITSVERPGDGKAKMKEVTDWSIDAMHIKTPNQETKIRSLSGGNQQKVILGRWLLTEPEVLLLDEPTRGIDVGAKYEIYQLIIDLTKKGKTCIVVSSEMPELLGICDRILVMSGGKLAGEVDASNTSQEEIMALAAKYA